MELSNKMLALLSPFRYSELKSGGICIDRLLDKTKESVIIPEGVTMIWNGAFEGAKNLKKLYLPASLTYIGESVFWDMQNLSEIHLGDIDRYIKITFKDAPQQLVNYYQDGKLITSYTLPEGTKEVPDHAFCGMGSLKEIILPEGLEKIGNYAFCYCGLTSVTLPKTLKTIGSYAFWANRSLKEITIPEGVSELSYGALGCCFNLRKINLPRSLKTIATDALLHAALTEAILPEGVTSIGANAFRECKNLRKVALPASCEKIGDYAFYRCTALTEISMQNGLQAIGANAISNCDALKELTIPRTVTKIAHYAFAANPSLERLYLPPYNVTLGQGIIMNCPALHEVSTDGYAYVKGTLIQLFPYEETMGALSLTVDDASYLASMPIPKQIDVFRVKTLTVREVDDCEVGRSLVMKTLSQSSPDALLVKGGVIVGMIANGTSVLVGETKCIYHSTDNNGAGTKGMAEYATFMLARMDSEAE